jgi:septal ring factor EnvC (AmiA/AmiB activator)
MFQRTSILKYRQDTLVHLTKRLALLVLCCCVVGGSLRAQRRAALEQQRKQLLQEINQTNALLEKTKQDKAAALDRYFALQNQIQKRQQLVKTLQSEISSADAGIEQANDVLETLGEDLNRLKSEYAATMRHTLRHRIGGSFTLFLFSARDLNDAFQRWQYIRQYYQYRRRQAQRIVNTQAELTNKAAQLEQEKAEKTELIAAQQQQQSTLNAELADKDRLVKSLKQDESQLVAELKEQQAAHTELNRAIEKIIRAEIARKKKASRKPEALTAAREEGEAADADLSGRFEQRQGRLLWPVAQGYIIRQFGTQPHPTVQGIQISNNGIDIRTDPAAEVYAVFDGKVVGTQFVPGYQNMVIVQHGIYYTVYSNLEEVLVRRGDRLAMRQAIGKVSSDKPEVHFEVWHEKDRLNPVHWVSQSQ